MQYPALPTLKFLLKIYIMQEIFQIMPKITHYAGIMLYAFQSLLC